MVFLGLGNKGIGAFGYIGMWDLRVWGLGLDNFRTISDTPGTVDVYLEEDSTRKFYQCEYGWWDHSIAIGNIH